MYKRFLILVLGVSAFACKQEASQQTEPGKAEQAVPLKETLPGTWESVSIRVEVNTAGNTDSSYVFEVLEEDWAERLATKPIKYYFQPDNKYRQEFIALNDEIMSTAKGMWNTFGNTLMLIEPDATYQYQVSSSKGLMQFSATLDWDGDEQEDDNYLGIFRKISLTTE